MGNMEKERERRDAADHGLDQDRKFYDMLVKWHNKYGRDHKEAVNRLDEMIKCYDGIIISGKGTVTGKAGAKGRYNALVRLRNRCVEHYNKRVRILNKAGLIVHGSYIHRDDMLVGHIGNWVYTIRKHGSVYKYKQLSLW